MPLVSICIPTYNTAHYLGAALESVLAQDFQDYELVVCDNASTDNTPDVVRAFNDPRLRYLRFTELTNQSGNFNRCLAAARGELVTLLHSDDFFLPGFLADRVERFRQEPELGFVFGAVQVVDAAGAEVSRSIRWATDKHFAPNEILPLLLQGCLVCPPSLMVRKACAERAGLFRTDLTWGHDWEWTLRLAEQGTACYAAEPLAAYRVHDGSGTADILNAAKNGDQERRVLQETFARLGTTHQSAQGFQRTAYQALSRRQMYFAEQSLLAARKKVARHNLWYAALADASMILRPTYWALFFGAMTPLNIYSPYRSLRNLLASSVK